MAFVVAGLVVVFAMCLLNLLFTFGVIRRLRQHTELLTAENVVLPARDPTISVGSSPEDFTATTTDGQPVSRDLLLAAPGHTIVAFFSPDCSSCIARMSDFILGVSDLRVERDRVLAVAVGDAEDTETTRLADKLARVARVVVEPMHGELATAFGVAGVPAMCLLESGVVVATGRDLDDLPAPAPA